MLIGEENGMFQIGKVSTQSFISLFGTVHIAANDVRYTMTLSIISMWIFRVGLSYLFGKYLGMGVTGIWYAMICDWIFRAICYGTRFARGTWLTKYKALK